MIQKIHKTEDEWREILTDEQYRIMREKDTERPFTCEFKDNKGLGIFSCAACGLDLFQSDTKFESGTGWPSFYEPIDEKRLLYADDFRFGMNRTEVLCARCESHLGHVFEDGPAPTGRRFCLNGIALKFTPKK